MKVQDKNAGEEVDYAHYNITYHKFWTYDVHINDLKEFLNAS